MRLACRHSTDFALDTDDTDTYDNRTAEYGDGRQPEFRDLNNDGKYDRIRRF